MEPFGVERLLSTEADTSGRISQSAGVYLVYAPGSRIAWISVDSEAIKLRKALENTLIARLRPPINAQVATSDISVRRQWFAKFKRDGYYPEFKGDRPTARGSSPQSKILRPINYETVFSTAFIRHVGKRD